MDMKIVWEVRDIPEKVKKIAIVFYGPGNPESQHDLVGIVLLDQNDNPIRSTYQDSKFDKSPDIVDKS